MDNENFGSQIQGFGKKSKKKKTLKKKSSFRPRPLTDTDTDISIIKEIDGEIPIVMLCLIFILRVSMT